MDIYDKLNNIFESSYSVEGEYEIETDEGEFIVDATITIEKDSNYGADADGNRGIASSWIGDIVINNVFDISKQQHVKKEDLSSDTLEQINSYIKDNADTDPDEPDYEEF